METERIRGEIGRTAAVIQNGGLVAVPTETVYGLAANGLNEEAVARIYEVKGRPAVKPLSLMVPDESAMERYCLEVPEAAHALARRFWPGPLTIVLKAREEIPAIVLAGGSTVGLRCPDHPLTLELLRACGLPLAAPSANPSGEPSPKTAEAVLSYFNGTIEAVIDGGPCGLGRESTLIDLSQKPYRILRQGALEAERIADALIDQMCLVGITGPSGSGKTSFLRVIEEEGGLALDCDEIYHELLETDAALLGELDAAFPGTVRNKKLDRKALASRVFSNPEALARLNAIAHRYVCASVRTRLRAFALQGGELAGIDAVELVSSGLGEDCDCVVGVLAERETRLARIQARDKISREAAEKRLDAQRPDSYYRENCDRILLNNAEQEKLKSACRQVLKEIQKHG